MDGGYGSASASASESFGADSAALGKGAAMVRVEALRKFPELVKQLGGDPNALLSCFQIDPAILACRHAMIPYGSFVHLLERASVVLGCPGFGMRLAAFEDAAKVFGPLEVAMRNSVTLGEAFVYCTQHLQTYSTAMQMHLVEDRVDDSMLLRFDLLVPKLLPQPQGVEHILLLMQRNALDFSCGHVRAHEILLTHEPLSRVSTYRSYFGAAIKFGQSTNGLRFDRCNLDLRIPNADTQLHELANDFIEHQFSSTEPDLRTRVRLIIEGLLPAGNCTAGAVASVLGINNARTLGRRLQVKGESFNEILDSVRRDVALRYLQQKAIPLTRIAELLGYASTTILSRSCSRWFSVSPRQLRRRRGEDANRHV